MVSPYVLRSNANQLQSIPLNPEPPMIASKPESVILLIFGAITPAVAVVGVRSIVGAGVIKEPKSTVVHVVELSVQVPE